MPRVEAYIRYEAPVRIGTLLRVGIDTTLENPRRLRHAFEMTRDDDARARRAGFVRVACVDLIDFTPLDLPEVVVQFVDRIQALAVAQAKAAHEVPWT